MLRTACGLLMLLGAATLLAAAPLAAQSGERLRGDVNGDGRVTAADARLVADFLVGRPTPAGLDIAGRGDVNGDGRVTAVDAAIISAFAAGREVSRFALGQPAELPNGVLARIDCRGSVAARQISCGAPALPGNADLIAGGQNVYVKLTSSNPAYNGGTQEFTFDVTVQNLMPQALGTTDGDAADPAGVRVFFASGPTATAGAGTISVVGDGTGTFTAASQPYYQYSQIIAPTVVSASRQWKLNIPNTVGSFAFTVYVNAPVEFPDGWIEIYPPAANRKNPSQLYPDTILPLGTLQLTDSIRRASGAIASGQAVAWSHTAHAHATVHPASGLVTGGATPGRDTVSGTTTSGTARSGQVVVVVDSALADSSTVTESAASATAGDSVTITVQARSRHGASYPVSGGSVVLGSTAGTLSAVTDHGDGTYTARLTHSGTGAVAVGGTLNGVVMGDSAHVTFAAGAPASMVKSAGDGQNATVGSAVASAPAVTVSDAHGNPVAGVSVTFAVTSGGGGVTGSPAVTNASGVATLGSWTLGTSAGANTLDASSSGLTTVTFSATGTAGAAANLAKSAGDGQSATVNTNLGVAPAVTVTDSHGNPVAGVSVTFAVAGGGGSVTGSPATTNASGVATLGSWKLGTTAGANSLNASSAGLTTVTFAATGTAGAPANLVKSAGDGQSATVNSNVATAPAVTITDAFANPVAGVSVTFTPSAGGSATGSPATTNASGVATVTSWKLKTAAGANTLAASSAGLTTVTFNGTGTADVPATLTRTSTDPQNGTVGVAVGNAPTVHVVDQYGNPTPGITVNFAIAGGGGSRTGAAPVTDASGNAAVGSWTPGGTGPGPNQLSATAAGGSNPAATFTAWVPPLIGGDSSQVMGNTTAATPVTPDVDANDVGLNGEALVISTTGALATVRGGTLTLAANGTFSYLPPAGNVLRDSVLYTIGDSHLSASGYIKLRFVGKVWYVDNTFAGAATGRDVSPFTSVANAEAVALANDTILVRSGSGTTAGGTLKNGQLLRGQGHNAAFTTTLNGQGLTLLATGTAPNVGTLTLGSGNFLRGMRIFSAAGGGLIGASVGTLSLGEMSIGVSGGPALDLSTGTVTGNGGVGAAVLDSLRSTSSASTGINLNGVAGTLTINGGIASSITGPTGAAVSITGSNPTLAFPGPISKTNGAGTGINLVNLTGGAATFSGPSVVLSTGSSPGINMTSSAATLSLIDSVKINTSSGTGINATGGGTLSLTGTHNSVASTAGIGVNLNGTTIGAAGLSFRSIDAAGGANGIAVVNAGSVAGSFFQVTGSGTDDSGGLLQNNSGDGIILNNVQTVSLTEMRIVNSTDNAMDLTSVNGLTLDGFEVAGTGNTAITGNTVTNFKFQNGSTITGAGNGANEYGINLTTLRGANNAITNSSVAGSQTINLFVQQSDGSCAPTVPGQAATLTISNSTLNSTNVTNGGDGVSIQGNNGGVLTLNLTGGNNLNNNQGDGIQISANNCSNITATVNGATSNYNGNLGSAVNIAAANTATITALVTGFSGVSTGTNGVNGLNVINIQNFDTSLINAKVENNLITGLGNNASGIRVIQEGNGTITTRLFDNRISGLQANGIIAQARAGTGTINMTIQNDTVNLASGFPLDGVSVESGSSAGGDANTVCLNMPSNSSSAAGGQQGYRLRQRTGTTFRLQNFAGSGSSSADITTWVNTTKANGGSTDIVIGTAFSNAPANCPTPP